MTHQARAESTRRAILSAAVEVFHEAGYGNASLTEIIDRAGVTKGACYYHFPTKAAVASALIAESDAVIEEAICAVWHAAPLATNVMESLIRAAFVVADCARFDNRIRIGFHLMIALGEGEAERSRYERQRAFLVEAVDRAISEGDINTEVSASDLGYTLWVSLLGNHLLSEAVGEDLTAALARLLRSILPGVCTARSRSFFLHFVDRLDSQYALTAAEQTGRTG